MPSPLAISLQDIRAARARIADQLDATPCLHSRTLSQLTGAQIYIKFENLQFTASFKERGALNRLLQLSADERRRGVCTMSAGNHGQAVAYHAQRLGIPATIVMPRHTPFVKVEHTRAHGAQVVLHGDTLDEAFAHTQRLGAAQQLVLVHPYDDPYVMAGQGTVALEMLETVPDLQVLLVPIGGGGLVAGVAVAVGGVVAAGGAPIEVIGVQARSYPSMPAALCGEQAVCQGNTIAEGIVVKSAGVLTRAVVRERVHDIVLVSESELECAIALLLNVEKTVAEGAGAAGLAALLAQPERFRGRRVGLILSGGNIDPRLLASVIMRELVREQRIVTLLIAVADQPGALARVTQIVGEQGGNILDVFHRRLSLEVPAKSATLELSFEARDAPHARAIVAAIRAAGFDASER
ncbi:MAG TPA: threonine ammonia-lyase [Steroidobacteraceae bacterium]|jgi:threonine dehydratase|nr:threonine ammonia-lyase [Steroidobacteraceae bacterium]